MIALLTRLMDDAWERFREALEGLTADEYHWRPSFGALTLADFLPPDDREDLRAFYAKLPDAPSTIEYKVAHVAACKIMYVEYAFREGRLRWRWADLNVPKTLDAMRAYLDNAHTILQGCLKGLNDSDLRVPRKTNWGELWPTERILWEMIVHDIYHGAQIRTTRAFYRAAHRPQPRLGAETA
ncbi:MAG: DinB family protein [bacterium]